MFLESLSHISGASLFRCSLMHDLQTAFGSIFTIVLWYLKCVHSLFHPRIYRTSATSTTQLPRVHSSSRLSLLDGQPLPFLPHKLATILQNIHFPLLLPSLPCSFPFHKERSWCRTTLFQVQPARRSCVAATK